MPASRWFPECIHAFKKRNCNAAIVMVDLTYMSPFFKNAAAAAAVVVVVVVCLLVCSSLAQFSLPPTPFKLFTLLCIEYVCIYKDKILSPLREKTIKELKEMEVVTEHCTSDPHELDG